MPTVLRVGPYRFYFYSSDGDEPIHVHVLRDLNTSKFWIDPVRLVRSRGFNPHEIVEIQRIIEDNKETIIKKWNEYFRN